MSQTSSRRNVAVEWRVCPTSSRSRPRSYKYSHMILIRPIVSHCIDVIRHHRGSSRLGGLHFTIFPCLRGTTSSRHLQIYFMIADISNITLPLCTCTSSKYFHTLQACSSCLVIFIFGPSSCMHSFILRSHKPEWSTLQWLKTTFWEEVNFYL